MRIWGFFGCLYVTLDLAIKALSPAERVVFQNDAWFYWLFAAGWAVGAASHFFPENRP